MECNNCNKTHKSGSECIRSIPYVAHEVLLAKAERRARIFGICAAVAAAALLVSNTVWICTVIA